MSDDLKQIKLCLLAIAEVLQVTLSKKQIQLYARILQDLGASGLERAFAAIAHDPDIKAGHFPLPGRIRELADGDLEDIADEITQRIMASINRHGSREPGKARFDIGELGWQVVETYGWPTLCSMNMEQAPIYVSQIRGLTRAALSRSRKAKAATLISANGEARLLLAETVLGGEK